MSASITWQKSSFSESEGSCVEIARCEAGINIRESDTPEVVIWATRSRLGALITDIKVGGLVA
ncbi:hypothetical protein FHS39_002881 [Streptomyces olivoverticillatus]|uniref:DUF397 domain-containing protein n=1 Tax=Streptomyces olivoverticillatus TaxID=66427 RepID=A0A7W7LPH3_9ACTN|nr:DUF397 domain-containing protein [Streptomyces olivoverticillatus]MBB4893847.1 hypothetical protein [Streptomyces olivoverticillatus]